jgi:hypothetical protein
MVQARNGAALSAQHLRTGGIAVERTVIGAALIGGSLSDVSGRYEDGNAAAGKEGWGLQNK